ncbi:patched family protein [Cooperia oncophora]
MTVFMAVAFHHISLICQPILILGALASPAIATATTFAILGWLKFPFNSIMCITPFLVMGIGVDDAFLLLHSWRNHGHLEKKERMRMVVHAVGPSMAITSATNTLAFGIGIVSPSPQMSAFCLCTCIAIFLDFIFEFLIFGSMIAIFYKEREVKHELLDNLVSWESYTKVLLSPLGRAIVIATTLVIYCLAFIGINGMKTVFDPTKTFPTDSILTPSFGKFEKIQSEYYPINFISLVPALEDEAGKKKFFEMIGRLEHGDGCYGPERTQLMLRYFIEWGEAQNITNLTYDDLPRFLSNRNIGDETVIHYKNNNSTMSGEGAGARMSQRITGDLFRLAVEGWPGELDWNKRAMQIDRIRGLIDEYPQFQTSLFDYDSTIYDIIITVKGEMAKSVAITFACMTATCAIMIPCLAGASVATLSMLSISYCTF